MTSLFFIGLLMTCTSSQVVSVCHEQHQVFVAKHTIRIATPYSYINTKGGNASGCALVLDNGTTIVLDTACNKGLK